MAYERGIFKKYYNAKNMNIHLGAGKAELRPGNCLEFDGATVKMGALEFDAPNVAGAIKAGWLTEMAPKGIELASEPVYHTPKVESPIKKFEVVDAETEIVGKIKLEKQASMEADSDVGAGKAKPRLISEINDTDRAIREIEAANPFIGKKVVKVEGSDEIPLTGKGVKAAFEWDTTRHWKVRLTEALKHRDNPEIFDKIMSLENDKVRGLIQKTLALADKKSE